MKFIVFVRFTVDICIKLCILNEFVANISLHNAMERDSGKWSDFLVGE